MRYNRIFLDTAFVQALLNKKDEFHEKAKSLTTLFILQSGLNRMLSTHHLREAKEVWITEAVLTEIGNALSKIARKRVVSFIKFCLWSMIFVVSIK